MKIIKFDRQTASAIQAYGSQGILMSRVVKRMMEGDAVVIYVAPRGVIGYHPTEGEQLFMVVIGSGWVSGEDRQRVEIEAGQAALCQAGEWHESGSEAGMTVVVLEARELEVAASA